MSPRTGTCKRGHPVEGDNRIVNPNGTWTCRACRTAYNKARWASGKSRESGTAWRKRNPHRIRDFHVSRYGIRLADYEALLEKQGGLCAICKQPERALRKGKPVNLCVDHDHDTGIVRGLLCRSCNSALGFIEDSAETAETMAAYLRGER